MMIKELIAAVHLHVTAVRIHPITAVEAADLRVAAIPVAVALHVRLPVAEVPVPVVAALVEEEDKSTITKTICI